MLGIGEVGRRTTRVVPRADSGDLVDWEQVYREHAPSLRRLIERRVPKPVVDDVLQETFIRAYRSRERLDPARPLRPFLATLAIRSSIQWQRSRRTEDHLGPHAPAGGGRTTAFPGSDDHLTGLLESHGVLQALGKLSPRHRRLLYLHTVGYGCDDMASEDQLSPKAVRSALARARSNFRLSYRTLNL